MIRLRYLLLCLALAVLSTSCSLFKVEARRDYRVDQQSIITIDGKKYRWERRIVSTQPLETATYLVEM